MKIPFIPTVDSIISDFTKAATRLEALANLHTSKADLHLEIAAGRVSRANKATAEATRARSVAAKINQLIS